MPDQHKAPRVQMPRWNATISHSTAAAIIAQQLQCSIIVMQSEANER